MRLRPWLFLLAAIAVEITGVTIMKFVSGSGALAAFLFMYAMIGLSFYLLALAVRHLPVALTYAIWETIGLVCVTFIGFRYFGERLGWLKLLGMAVLLAGVVLVNLGAPKAAQE